MPAGKFLGRITHATYGMGGYQDVQWGLSLQFSFDGYGMGCFIGTWASYPEGARYTREWWNERRLEALDKLVEVMADAKVSDVSKLVGKPVELEVENNTFKSFRILKEVL